MLVRLQTKSGRPVSPIGIGTWGFGTFPFNSPGADTEVAAIRYAISLGQNHIDTAELYSNGGAERIIGRAIAHEERHDLFIASKIWKNHVAKGQVRPAVAAMLERLGTHYLDLLYIHAPWFDAPWQEAMPQIEELIDEGVVRHFGVSNFNADRLREAQALARRPIAMDQLHYSVVHQSEVPLSLREYCAAQGITIVAYLPLERGNVLHNTTIASVAQQQGVTPAQVALAWLLAHGALPIPGSTQRRHIAENSTATTLQLAPEDMLQLDQLSA